MPPLSQPNPIPPSPGATGSQVTLVLDAIRAGDRDAPARLLPLVYDELKALARGRMAHLPPGNTLQPTALVHEAYLKLVGNISPDRGDGGGPAGESTPGVGGFDNRAHFFGAAARAMRDILVDQARRKGAIKAGGDRKREGLDGSAELVADTGPATPVFAIPEALDADMLRLDAALRQLERDDPRKAEVVMLKYFAGLEHEQIARALNVSVPTVERDWRFARSWLQKEMPSARDRET